MSVPADRPRRFRFALLAAGLSALAALLAGELAVRILSPHGRVTPETLRAISPAYVPSVFSSYELERKEKRVSSGPDWGNVPWRISARGHRGPDFAVPKAPGTIRILCYGGSSVFDMAQPEGEDWPRRVERLLRESGFPAAEVINAGVPGHASHDAVGRLFAEGHLFEPDVAVYYGTWNDIKRFDAGGSLLDDLRPYARADPRLNCQGSLDRILCETSQLYVRLRHRYYSAKLDAGMEGRARDAPLALALHPNALRQYRLALETFVDVARNAGAIPVLAIEARLPTRDAPPEERARIYYCFQPFIHETLCEAFERADGILRDVAARKGAALVDTSEMHGRGPLFRDHVHLSAEGSRTLARLVAEAVATALRQGKPSPGR